MGVKYGGQVCWLVPVALCPETRYDSLLVVVDRFTGHVLAFDHYVNDDANALAKLLVREVYGVFGVYLVNTMVAPVG